ncbi:nuclear transport factor 2 family protein [Streptomyces sp. GSL17-111]|uniref:nuclear transport factor 2 family protein n=1 Tax=Streptomyces sp. GSL17-111 TaxID=3121596 RepID=UPI0030F4A29F
MDIAELLELEHRGWQSLCDSTGGDFYGRLMTEDGVMVLAHGHVLSRQDVVASLSDAPPWRTYEISGERLVPLSEDSAALVYRGRAYREGAEPAFTALMSSVYVRRGTGWALALYQQTPVPE